MKSRPQVSPVRSCRRKSKWGAGNRRPVAQWRHVVTATPNMEAVFSRVKLRRCRHRRRQCSMWTELCGFIGCSCCNGNYRGMLFRLRQQNRELYRLRKRLCKIIFHGSLSLFGTFGTAMRAAAAGCSMFPDFLRARAAPGRNSTRRCSAIESVSQTATEVGKDRGDWRRFTDAAR